MPTTDADGMPIYGSTEPMPAWDVSYNAQSTALGAQMNARIAALKAGESVATIAALPAPADSWNGRIVFCEENQILHLYNGGWYAFAGKVPYFYGSRADSAVGTGGSPQNWITTNTASRGMTFSAGVITFSTVGVYSVDASATWEANGNGQRNLGVDGTDITVMGNENVLFPNAFVESSQQFHADILVNSPGATARPYVTHNTGLALDVYGTVSVRWVSA